MREYDIYIRVYVTVESTELDILYPTSIGLFLMQSLEQEGSKKVNLLHIYNEISCIRAIYDGITNLQRTNQKYVYDMNSTILVYLC